MRTLSKSKLLAYRQCPKRLWLEVHKPDLRQDSPATALLFAAGHQVGDVARKVYNAAGDGRLIDVQVLGYDEAIRQTTSFMAERRPIFEATFKAGGAFAMVDVLLPDDRAGAPAWRIVEIKSSTEIKDYHRDDVAIQSYIAKAGGVPISRVSLGYVNKDWVYGGDGKYDGFFVEEDLTQEAVLRASEVETWIADGQRIVSREAPPEVRTGEHCTKPYECGFLAYCRGLEATPKHPATWLPRLHGPLKKAVSAGAITEMADVPDVFLDDRQRRVKECTIDAKVYFDQHGSKKALEGYGLPAYFLDFETIRFVVPKWKGFRPNERMPFQFSLHKVDENDNITVAGFLDLTGNDASEACASALVACCGKEGPIYVYNASFEKSLIRELAGRVSAQAGALMAIHDRIVDLLPVTQECYYHPSQKGSWSIKKVLPAIFPDLSYDSLDGVNDGGLAMAAYLEATDPATSAERRGEIERQLRAYCAMDTWGIVKLWAYFLGRDLKE